MVGTYDLSVVIPNWNTMRLLRGCLQSILRETRKAFFEIIVVDNGSSDGSREMVKSQFPGVRLIENHRNVGFARACNEGIRMARGRYILLLNSDTVILDGALDRMVEFMDLHPNVGICGPKILNPDGSLNSMGGRNKRLFDPNWSAAAEDPLAALLRPFKTRFFDRREGRDPDKIADVDVVCGACLLVRRRVLDQIGLLDERLEIYNEEDDLCARAKEAGWRVYYFPKAEIIHYKGKTVRKREIAREIPIKAYKSKIVFHSKHHGKIAILLLILTLKTVALLQMLTYVIRYLVSPSKRERMKWNIYVRWHQLKCMAGLRSFPDESRDLSHRGGTD